MTQSSTQESIRSYQERGCYLEKITEAIKEFEHSNKNGLLVRVISNLQDRPIKGGIFFTENNERKAYYRFEVEGNNLRIDFMDVGEEIMEDITLFNYMLMKKLKLGGVI